MRPSSPSDSSHPSRSSPSFTSATSSTPSYDARLIESKWSQAWERDGCYRAPDLPEGPKYFNYDSGPFPNGPLHMGHVRTYLLGDVTARYQRALGKSVLYCTEWDAFGLPNELEAIRVGQSPDKFTRHWMGTMSQQLQTLGVSYDRSRIRATCDPSYYRWTQWLFLRLNELNLIARRNVDHPYCPVCETVLSHFQVLEKRCWRCRTKVETRRFPQWFLALSQHAPQLLSSLDRLEGWSAPVRNLVRGLLHSREGRVSMSGDWLISRQRSWGTPIPVIFCEACGTVPVPVEELPIRLPEDLDWSLGPRALSSHPSFVETPCPRCHQAARRETDTLDCFFDDIWCFLACLVDLEGPLSFGGERVQAWMPIDRFHSGFDTVAYLHLHRFLARVLNEQGEFVTAEPIQGHLGHEMVLAQGHKMSKHLGNAVSPSTIMRHHGADVVRVAMLWAASPHSAIEWRSEHLERATSLLRTVHRLYSRAAKVGRESNDGSSSPERPSKAMIALHRKARRSLDNMARFVEDYRPNAAIEDLAPLFRQTEAFTLPRLESARLSQGDCRMLREVLEAEIIALSLFAPHLAEELWHLMGNETYVVQQPWPRLSDGEPAV